MKIISTKEYNKLKETQSAYLELLMKPLQGVFEKVTDDDLLRENGLLNAENKRLNKILNELDNYDWINDVKNELYINCNGDEFIYKYYYEAITQVMRKFYPMIRELKEKE